MMFLPILMTAMATISMAQDTFFNEVETLSTYVFNSTINNFYLAALAPTSVQIGVFNSQAVQNYLGGPGPNPITPEQAPQILTGFNQPHAAWPGVDSTHFLVADTLNFVVRAVSTSDFAVSVFAGQVGMEGHSGDGGQATSATLYSPFAGVTNGTIVYIADLHSCTIRSVDSSSGIISTFFGAHRVCQSDSSHVNHPSGLATDGTYLYVSELKGNCILQISLTDATSNSYVIGSSFAAGYTPDGSYSPSATISHPDCLFLCASGLCFCERQYIRQLRGVSLTTLMTLQHPRGGWYDSLLGILYAADPKLHEIVAISDPTFS